MTLAIDGSVETNLADQLAKEIGAKTATEIADAFVATIRGGCAEIEANGQGRA